MCSNIGMFRRKQCQYNESVFAAQILEVRLAGSKMVVICVVMLVVIYVSMGLCAVKKNYLCSDTNVCVGILVVIFVIGSNICYW